MLMEQIEKYEDLFCKIYDIKESIFYLTKESYKNRKLDCHYQYSINKIIINTIGIENIIDHINKQRNNYTTIISSINLKNELSSTKMNIIKDCIEMSTKIKLCVKFINLYDKNDFNYFCFADTFIDLVSLINVDW